MSQTTKTENEAYSLAFGSLQFHQITLDSVFKVNQKDPHQQPQENFDSNSLIFGQPPVYLQQTSTTPIPMATNKGTTILSTISLIEHCLSMSQQFIKQSSVQETKSA